MTTRPLSLFEGYGIEIEAIVVDAKTLDVRPVVDELLRRAAGRDAWVEDFDDGDVGWSNELVTHVVELKTMGPVATLAGCAARFVASTGRLNALLADLGARLMPTGMHPWMDPTRETRLWPHDHGPVYRAYDRLFDCHRHGWANLQSVHLNLPFADEDEFARLLAAVRLVLPLIPGLAASSPIVAGRATGILDNRLEHYRTNSARVAAMTGDVIPEPIFGFDEYRQRIFGAIDDELRALGADEALLGQEWTNARGAIARFDRMAIEIRLIDAQECAPADLAVCAAVSGAVKALVEERWSAHADQRRLETAALARQLGSAIADGPRAPVHDRALARAFGLGLDGRSDTTLADLWRHLAERAFDGPPDLEEALCVVLREGTLAERILAALGEPFDRARLADVYRDLCECLAHGRSFRP